MRPVGEIESVACRRAGWLAMAMLGAACLAGAGGCEKQLFPQDEPRSQYDRFDRIRENRAPEKIEDAFGNNRPNLRGRLLTGE